MVIVELKSIYITFTYCYWSNNSLNLTIKYLILLQFTSNPCNVSSQMIWERFLFKMKNILILSSFWSLGHRKAPILDFHNSCNGYLAPPPNIRERHERYHCRLPDEKKSLRTLTLPSKKVQEPRKKHFYTNWPRGGVLRDPRFVFSRILLLSLALVSWLFFLIV